MVGAAHCCCSLLRVTASSQCPPFLLVPSGEAANNTHRLIRSPIPTLPSSTACPLLPSLRPSSAPAPRLLPPPPRAPRTLPHTAAPNAMPVAATSGGGGAALQRDRRSLHPPSPLLPCPPSLLLSCLLCLWLLWLGALLLLEGEGGEGVGGKSGGQALINSLAQRLQQTRDGSMPPHAESFASLHTLQQPPTVAAAHQTTLSLAPTPIDAGGDEVHAAATAALHSSLSRPSVPPRPSSRLVRLIHGLQGTHHAPNRRQAVRAAAAARRAAAVAAGVTRGAAARDGASRGAAEEHSEQRHDAQLPLLSASPALPPPPPPMPLPNLTTAQAMDALSPALASTREETGQNPSALALGNQPLAAPEQQQQLQQQQQQQQQVQLAATVAGSALGLGEETPATASVPSSSEAQSHVPTAQLPTSADAALPLVQQAPAPQQQQQELPPQSDGVGAAPPSSALTPAVEQPPSPLLESTATPTGLQAPIPAAVSAPARDAAGVSVATPLPEPSAAIPSRASQLAATQAAVSAAAAAAAAADSSSSSSSFHASIKRTRRGGGRRARTHNAVTAAAAAVAAAKAKHVHVHIPIGRRLRRLR